jgi:hypothetical protein
MLTFEQAKQVLESLTSQECLQLSAFKAAESMMGFDLIRQESDFGCVYDQSNLSMIRLILSEKQGCFHGLQIDISGDRLSQLITYLAAEYRKGKTREFLFCEEKTRQKLGDAILANVHFLSRSFDSRVSKVVRAYVEDVDL